MKTSCSILALFTFLCTGCALRPPSDLALLENEAREERIVPPLEAFGPHWCGLSVTEYQITLGVVRQEFVRVIREGALESYFPRSVASEDFPLGDMSRADYALVKRLASERPQQTADRLTQTVSDILARMARYHRYRVYLHEKRAQEEQMRTQ